MKVGLSVLSGWISLTGEARAGEKGAFTQMLAPIIRQQIYEQ